jgi:serine/threonine protein phosphatase PrpC
MGHFNVNLETIERRVILPSGGAEKIFPDVMPVGTAVDFFDSSGKKYFSFMKNTPSNERKVKPNLLNLTANSVVPAPLESYTLVFANGKKILLPLAAFFQSETFKLIREDEKSLCDEDFLREAMPDFPYDYTIEIQNDGVIFSNRSKKELSYTIQRQPEQQRFSFGYGFPEAKTVPQTGCDIDLAPDKYAAFFNGKGDFMAAIYEVEDDNKKQFIFRDADRKQVIKMTAGHEYLLPLDDSTGKNLRVRITHGKIYVFDNPGVSYNVVSASHKWRAETGGDAEVSGLINGGRRFYAATYRELGESKYDTANESNAFAGLANGVMGVIDGMGGNGFGDKASFLAAETIVSGKGFLEGLVLDAHDELYFFNRYMLLNSLPHCDAVLAGVRLSGDSFEGASLGDAHWVQIRNGRIIAKSPDKSVLGEFYEAGLISKFDLMTRPERNIVKTALLLGFEPEVFKGELESGDIIVTFDDGLAIDIENELAEIAGIAKTPEEFAKIMLKRTEDRNNDLNKCYTVTDESGLGFSAPSPRDNVAVAVYFHD